MPAWDNASFVFFADFDLVILYRLTWFVVVVSIICLKTLTLEINIYLDICSCAFGSLQVLLLYDLSND